MEEFWPIPVLHCRLSPESSSPQAVPGRFDQHILPSLPEEANISHSATEDDPGSAWQEKRSHRHQPSIENPLRSVKQKSLKNSSIVLYGSLWRLILSIASFGHSCSFRLFGPLLVPFFFHDTARLRPSQRMIRSRKWGCSPNTVAVLWRNAFAERNMPSQKKETEKPVSPTFPMDYARRPELRFDATRQILPARPVRSSLTLLAGKTGTNEYTSIRSIVLLSLLFSLEAWTIITSPSILELFDG